jgi:hypothetical protein
MQTTKRTKDEIFHDLLEVFLGLEPERLTCNGECTNAEVVERSRILFTKLAKLEKELGHKVDEDEVYKWDMKRINL